MVDQTAGLIPPFPAPLRGEASIGSTPVMPLWMAASVSHDSRHAPALSVAPVPTPAMADHAAKPSDHRPTLRAAHNGERQ